MNSKLRILVTGSSGFLGSWLVADLIEAGHFVIGIDLRRSDFPYQRPQRFIQEDLKTFESSDLKFDLCIHLASAKGGFLRNWNQASLVEDEIEMLTRLRQLCWKAQCARIIFSSSIAVFEGKKVGAEGPVQEPSAKSAYAKAKIGAESYIAENFLDYTVIRPTNFFGPLQPRWRDEVGESHVIPDLLYKIENQTTVEVLGDGTQIRNFIHISDVSDFIQSLLEPANFKFTHLRSELFLDIKSLVKLLMKSSNCSKPIKFLPEYMKYEASSVFSFAMPAASSIGWSAKHHSLLSGLRVSRMNTKPIETRSSASQAPQELAVVASS